MKRTNLGSLGRGTTSIYTFQVVCILLPSLCAIECTGTKLKIKKGHVTLLCDGQSYDRESYDHKLCDLLSHHMTVRSRNV
jgi:hypothetical protein